MTKIAKLALMMLELHAKKTCQFSEETNFERKNLMDKQNELMNN
jgi:hypothetical protein